MRNDPTAWLEAARRELDALLAASSTPLTDADAWRALALTARISQAPANTGASPPDPRRVEAWVDACAVPDEIDLVDALVDALVGDAPPEAIVLDSLLDIDDLAGVFCLTSRDDDARRLIDEANASLAVQPERVVSLSSFARMRLATLRPELPNSVLWRQVEGSLFDLAVASQPLATAPSVAAIALRERMANESNRVSHLKRRLPLPAPVALAAASHGSDSRALGTTDDGIEGWLYEHKGESQLELALADDTQSARHLLLIASKGDTELARVSLPARREGRGVFASLGPNVGPDNIQQATSARLGRDPSDIEWSLEINDDP